MVIEETIPVPRGSASVRALVLRVMDGLDRGAHHETSAETVSIGTGATNDLVLTDETVSRYHLELARRPDGVHVVDHGSTNGTIINGVRVQTAAVDVPSTIRIGRTTLSVSDGAEVAIAMHESEALTGLIGTSASMRKLMAVIRRVAKSDASVLVNGETGSGKEVVARAIHDNSPRASQPLEIVDCGAVLPALIASELFGHERGAFTGAERQHIGAFERADGGTVFLDEIGELPPGLQTALLGVLERQRFTRVGGRDPISIDVRVVAATNRDLRREVNAGTFRQDLYYRIAVVTLAIPPLRERTEDLELLAEHFLRRAGREDAIPSVLTPHVLERLRAHYWPGNVRELRNTIDAALAMGEPPEVRRDDPPPAEVEARGDIIQLDELTDRPYNDARAELVERFESAYIAAILERNGDNVSAAARDAGMHRSYLTKMLRRHGIRLRRVPTDPE